jgi:hypothetical protein
VLYALLETIVEQTRRPASAPRPRAGNETEPLDALAFVVLTSQTLRAGFDAFIRYQRIFADGERYEIETDDTWVKIVYSPWEAPRLAHRFMTEMFAATSLTTRALLREFLSTGRAFPSRVGGYQSPNVLAKPIVAIADAAKIEKHLSPYFMRRTFQDLCRAA